MIYSYFAPSTKFEFLPKINIPYINRMITRSSIITTLSTTNTTRNPNPNFTTQLLNKPKETQRGARSRKLSALFSLANGDLARPGGFSFYRRQRALFNLSLSPPRRKLERLATTLIALTQLQTKSPPRSLLRTTSIYILAIPNSQHTRKKPR